MLSKSGKLLVVLLAAGFPAVVLACQADEGGIPEPTDTKSIDAPIEVGEGEVFDAEWVKYDRGEGACKEQEEGGQGDTVFIVRRGGTLKNVIIGKNQGEGVYCLGPCTLESVWFEDVCEDAISIKEDVAGDETWIIGGGAYHAADKVIQHNGCGKVNVVNFYAEDYGKVYRACGTCTACKRTVYLEGVTAYDGGEVAGINIATGDEATLVDICTDAKTPCQLYDGPGEKAGAC